MTSSFLGWVSELARAHTRPLTAVAVREGLEHEDAIEAVQEAFLTFLRLPQARELSDEPDGAARLMSVLVRNTARNARRRHCRVLPHEPLSQAEGLQAGELSTEDLLVAAERHVALAGCVRRLARVQQLVVTMRLLEELTPEATARELSLTSGHVGVLLHRAKAALRDCLEERRWAELG